MDLDDVQRKGERESMNEIYGGAYSGGYINQGTYSEGHNNSRWIIPEHQAEDMDKWIAYTSDKHFQITVQPTYGRGKIKGNYEVLMFDLWDERGKGITLKNTETFTQGINYAKSYINWGEEYRADLEGQKKARA